ncbi:aspartate/glutamate racemase family protein [Gemmobacter sp.]|uniref:aspartate/glutamate racemase family protein n=1 Tax=Gemmobacter sp. TaxID=1898957 RepID=UPI002AFF9946|nr:aspartate/glutamate racemase family protein [Gemmobacter sp.]
MDRLIRVIVPIPLPRAALDNFAAQLPPGLIGPGFAVDFVGTRNGGQLGGDQMEVLLFGTFVYDAGVAALRARLTIPVIGSGATAFLMACQLGKTFSVISMWGRWNHFYAKILAEQGLAGRCVSMRDVGIRPDTAELLPGKEHFIFDRLEQECRRAIDEDGAEVIVPGSTTMHQSHAHLARVLPVPVINPGVVSCKAAEALVQLGLAQSKAHYHQPERPMDDIFAHVPAVFP